LKGAPSSKKGRGRIFHFEIPQGGSPFQNGRPKEREIARGDEKRAQNTRIYDYKLQYISRLSKNTLPIFFI
jgi:hypothetical protein